MFNKTPLLAGLTIACALSAPAAFAQEYTGFYFGVWGGGGSVDSASKSEFDEVVLDSLPLELAMAAAQISNADQQVTLALGSTGESSLDDSVSTWGVQVGYRWGKYFASEVGYANLGQASYRLPATVNFTVSDADGFGFGTFDVERDSKFSSSGPTLSAIGILPLGERFDLQARGGIYLADTRLTNRIRDIEFAENVGHRRVDASETELLGGVAANWNVTERLSLRLEYQRFFNVGDDSKTGESDVDVFNLGVLFR
jgi:OOP family OmpA-OmpF porin